MKTVEHEGVQKTLDRTSDYEIVYQDLNIHESTFKGKRLYAIQSWFRLTPSFSPNLVQLMLKEMDTSSKDLVLDPFVGTGTTIVQCKLLGINSIGVEINPVLYEIAKASTNWEFNIGELEHDVNAYVAQVKARSTQVKDIKVDDFPTKLHIELPKIYNIKRWWRDDVLKDLLVAKQLITAQETSDNVKEFLRVGLMCILVEVANIARKHPTLTFADRSAEQIDVVSTLYEQLMRMVKDIRSVQSSGKTSNCCVVLGDSTKLSSLVPEEVVTRVITSPPYPNRISYVWETRPHLYFFDIFSRPIEAGLLDSVTIGGTWGRATSILHDGIIKPNSPTVRASIEGIAEAIRNKNESDSRANLMANYVTKYFNMMYDHFVELSKIVSRGCKCAYVVGNSRIKNVDVPTDVLLADLFNGTGFEIDKIIRTRKRIGRRNLYEAIVLAERA